MKRSPVSPQRLQEAFDQRKRAHGEGKTLEDNPYAARGKEGRKWYEGWCEASLVQHHNRMQQQ